MARGLVGPHVNIVHGNNLTDEQLKAFVDLGVTTIDLNETGAVSYSLRLFAGTYDVLVLSNGATNQSVLPDALEGLVPEEPRGA